VSIIGITGTRQLNDAGRQHIILALLDLDPAKDSIVCGGCRGVDAFAGQVAKLMGLKVMVALPEDDSQTDTSWISYAATFKVVGPYRERNQYIVDHCDGVWAFPNHATQQEDPHSGTWMTVNMAKRAKKLAYLKPQHPKQARSE
jgi:predicted Rossmann fold nucleotide-binding protein DprA/Smf involved in DNA uptake